MRHCGTEKELFFGIWFLGQLWAGSEGDTYTDFVIRVKAEAGGYL